MDVSDAEFLESGADHVTRLRAGTAATVLAAAAAGFVGYPVLHDAAPEVSIPRLLDPTPTLGRPGVAATATPPSFAVRTSSGRLCEVSYQGGMPTEADCFASDTALRRWLAGDRRAAQRGQVTGGR